MTCICLHSPSVTMDRYRLRTKPTVTKRDLKIKKFMSSHPIPFRLVPTTMCLKMNSIVVVDFHGDALQLVLLIRGVSDFSSRQRL